MKPVLWIATNNWNKVGEYQVLFPNFEIKTLNDLKVDYREPVEDQTTFAGNALLKAKSLAAVTQELTLGDDSGICVQALNGFPGVYSKRWAAPITDAPTVCQKLLDKLDQETDGANRNAVMVTSLGFFDPQTKTELIFEGKVLGRLTNEVKIGSGEGFGYDLIFQPKNFHKTYSEMGQAEKNKLSPRQKASEKFQKYLESERENDQKN